jgi:putative ABC transport system permease protein
MGSLWLDVRYALRTMTRTPGLTAVLALTLALGIGASTTIFSVVNSIVLRPLPYKAPDQIVRVYTEFHGPNPLLRFPFSAPELGDLQRDCRSCEAVGGWLRGSAPMSGGDRPVRLQIAYSTHELLPILGVAPILGRWFDAAEDSPVPPPPGQSVGDPTVIVIGYNVWQRAFGGDPNVIGKKVQLDAMPVTVVGVMPRGFDFLDGIEAWVPARLDYPLLHRSSHGVNVIARLKPGVSMEALQSELDALLAQYGKKDTKELHMLSAEKHPIRVFPFKADLVGSLAKTLWLLQAAVLFVLLISIVNVANLLLARAESRNREVAVRHALGASRRRLVRQFITESMVLGLLGGALGVLVSVWAVDGITALIPKSAPRASEIRLDSTAVVFAVACSVAAALLFGLAPILHARRTDLHGALKDGSNRMTGTRASLRTRRGLVIAEIALAVLLVVGCTVMVRTFVKLQRVELGFKPDHMLTFGFTLPMKAYDLGADEAMIDRIEQRLQSLPGVESAALIDGLPPNRGFNAESIDFPGRTQKDTLNWNVDYWQIIGPGGLEVLGAKLVQGRTITASDIEGAPRVVVVNEAFVKKFLPNENPIGVEVTTYASGDPLKDKPARIVGVVRDIKNAGVDHPAGTEIFMPRKQYTHLSNPPLPILGQGAIIRTSGDPAALIPEVSRAISELDPQLPLFDVRTMDDVMYEAIAKPRFLTFLLASFAGIALLLAAVGIYGVMAHTVAQRTHEIGLRLALGAQPAQVRTMILRQAGMLVAVGLAVGLGGALLLQFALGSSLRTLLYGAELSQPLLLIGVVIAVAATALLATWIPVRRATKIEPSVALRSE